MLHFYLVIKIVKRSVNLPLTPDRKFWRSIYRLDDCSIGFFSSKNLNRAMTESQGHH